MTDNEALLVKCPHCGEDIIEDCGEDIIEALFHSPKSVCDALLAEGKIFGCGKPFRLVDNTPVVCDMLCKDKASSFTSTTDKPRVVEINDQLA